MATDEPAESDAPTQAASTAPAQGGSPEAAAQPGDARYVRGALIGRGGMGQVHVCEDVHVGRDVAFKTIRGAFDAMDHARFWREAKLQARLEHPAIVPVYDLGTAADGAPYFTMRRIGGTTLAEVIEKLRRGDPDATRTFSRRRLLSDFVRVAQAVAYANQRGVVHRDIKPANVIVSEFGEVYLLDWGIAKVRGDAWVETSVHSASHDGVHTEIGSVLGTLGYMPPEQLEGGGRDVDRRADVYALGATLFELLTLQPLHPRGDTAALIQSTIDGADARASVRAPDRDVPPELERICVQATASDPDVRHADVTQLVAEIERYLDGDRDLQRRRALANEHTERARAELVHARTDLQARARAAREAGRALALDPDRRDALEVITRLLVEPPLVVPPEVLAELDASDVEGSRAMARFGAYSRAAGFLILILIAWMGIRLAWPFWVLVGLMAFGTIAAAFFSVRGKARPVPTPVLFMNAIMLALFALVLGPFVLIPGLAAATSAMFMLGGALRGRTVALAGCLPIVVPWALAQGGWIPPSYTIAPEAVTIHPLLATFAPLPTAVLMLGGSVMVVVLTVLAVSGARARLRASRRDQLLQKWHLAQLVPNTSG